MKTVSISNFLREQKKRNTLKLAVESEIEPKNFSTVKNGKGFFSKNKPFRAEFTLKQKKREV